MNKFVASLYASAASLAVLASAPADARTGRCYTTTSGSTVCILAVRSHKTLGNRQKLVTSSVDGHVSTDEVICNPAYRYNYKPNLWGIACFEFH